MAAAAQLADSEELSRVGRFLLAGREKQIPRRLNRPNKPQTDACREPLIRPPRDDNSEARKPLRWGEGGAVVPQKAKESDQRRPALSDSKASIPHWGTFLAAISNFIFP